MEVSFSDGIHLIDPDESEYGKLLKLERIHTGNIPRINLPFSFYRLSRIYNKYRDIINISSSTHILYYSIGKVSVERYSTNIMDYGKKFITPDTYLSTITNLFGIGYEEFCECDRLHYYLTDDELYDRCEYELFLNISNMITYLRDNKPNFDDDINHIIAFDSEEIWDTPYITIYLKKIEDVIYDEEKEILETYDKKQIMDIIYLKNSMRQRKE